MGYKKALITGAAKGIGRQIAISMAKSRIRYRGELPQRRKAAMEVCRIAQESGVEAFPVYADMSVLADIRSMYDQVFDRFGAVDVLVNNAGISSEVYFSGRHGGDVRPHDGGGLEGRVFLPAKSLQNG